MTVALNISDAMENFRRLVIVREDDGVTAFSCLRSRMASISSANVAHSIGGMMDFTRSYISDAVLRRAVQPGLGVEDTHFMLSLSISWAKNSGPFALV